MLPSGGLPILRTTCALLISFSLFPAGLSAKEGKPARMVRIGVVKSVSNPAFDTNEKGFEKALLSGGYKERTNVIYDRQNAQDNAANAETIAQKFLNGRVDLIHSIGMPASQAVIRTIKHIPIVFSAVKNPVVAGLVPRKSGPGTRTGTNVTGVSDHWPISRQFEMFMRIVPKARKWGTVYNAEDAEAVDYIREMRETVKRLGVELIEATVSNKSEAAQAAQFLTGKVQAIHITADRTVLSSFEAIVKVCDERKIPLFAGDLSTASRGGIAAYGLDYGLVGISAGWRAERILNGQKPGDIPWGLSDAFRLIINEKAAKAQGVAIPPAILKQADKVIE